ncbi:hypothetical protein LIER_12048 [Lithospermum erythrorhizon]|uniref:NAD(P)-binding domain-containing protein n=1 Tax=Lithospermum erythrorhizon TaxID=34254 RepID=A0AAV3PRK1_LITER
MAPTISSNSFIFSTTPHSDINRLSIFKSSPRSTVFAKKAVDNSSEGNTNSSPFGFDFAKLSDVKSLIPVVANPSKGGLSLRRKDPGTVFVAGATGQSGIRIVQTLLRQGFSVRAGVTDLGAAQELARLAAKYKIISNEESKRLNAVESTFQEAESIAKAIGNASKVVVTVGQAENGPTTEVTTTDALRVIQASQLANVGHVAIVYDGSSVSGSTNNVFNGISSFFNNLFSRSQTMSLADFLQDIIETDLRYTLIKTKLTEDFSPECSYKVVVSPEESVISNDYKVPRSQIALMVADIFSNTSVAENKVVEVFTDPSAPLKTINELFSSIPEDKRRKEYLEAVAQVKAEEAALIANEKAREAAEATKKLETEVNKLKERKGEATSLAEEAEQKASAAGISINSLLDKAKETSSELSWEKLSSQLKSAVQKNREEPKVKIATVRGQAKARTLTPQKAVVKSATLKPPRPEPREVKGKQVESKKQVNKVFGGLFQQETIYVDDD